MKSYSECRRTASRSPRVRRRRVHNCSGRAGSPGAPRAELMVLRRRLPRKALTLHAPHRALTPDEALNMIRTVNPRADASFGLTFQCIPRRNIHGTNARRSTDTAIAARSPRSGGRSRGTHHLPLHRLPNAHWLGVSHKYPRAGRAFCSPQRHAEELCEDSRKRQ